MRQTFGFFIRLSFLLLLASAPHVHAQGFETPATSVVLIDVKSDTTLYLKDENARVAPASMAKLVTLAVVFDALSNGDIALEDGFEISEDAWRRGGAPARGSTMFADVGSTVSVDNLIKGIAVHSGNDAAIAIAQGMAGSEDVFAERMNALAERLGMTNSNFTNASGLPDPNQYSTAQDLAIIARYLLDQYPQYLHYFAIPEFTWNDIRQFNRNALLRLDIGVDGLKTGFIQASGFGMVVTAMQGTRRLLAVVTGFSSSNERTSETQRLLEWGFEAFQTVELFPENETLGRARTFGGTSLHTDVTAIEPVTILLPEGEVGRITARIRYQGPIKAPFEEGIPIGTMDIRVDGKLVRQQRVYTKNSMQQGNLPRRALDSVLELALGWI